MRWNSNRQDSPFFGQSGALYLSYYAVQIYIHRPFIPSLSNPSPTGFPSLAICTNAARSSCYIFDAFNKSNILPPPLVQVSFTRRLSSSSINMYPIVMGEQCCTCSAGQCLEQQAFWIGTQPSKGVQPYPEGYRYARYLRTTVECCRPHQVSRFL